VFSVHIPLTYHRVADHPRQISLDQGLGLQTWIVPVEQRLAAMTPDERAADAVALVQRIQARLAAVRLIEGEADNVTDAEETEEE
jgi:hypothetical protein